MNNGKRLENFVAFVEQQMLPRGLAVVTNRKVFDEDGDCLLELDIEVVSQSHERRVAWLIECRDRPSDGAQGVAWIEQLVARRARGAFDQVTAVSSTGFSPSAKKYALQERVELRELVVLTVEEFKSSPDWWESLVMSNHAVGLIYNNKLRAIRINLADGQSSEARREVDAFLARHDSSELAFRFTAFDARHSIESLLDHAVLSNRLIERFEKVPPDGAVLKFNLHIDYIIVGEAKLVFDSNHGAATISSIDFLFELQIVPHEMPLTKSERYRSVEEATDISLVAQYKVPADAIEAGTLEVVKVEGQDFTHSRLVPASGRRGRRRKRANGPQAGG